MNRIPLAGTLLFAYLVYTAFVAVSIPHSIILLSLAGLTGFELYIKVQQLPSMEKRMSDLKLELSKQMEVYDAKLAELKQEQQRVAIERANAASSAPSKKTQIVF